MEKISDSSKLVNKWKNSQKLARYILHFPILIKMVICSIRVCDGKAYLHAK